MQEMDVVKKGSATWIWVVIALAVVALVLWMTMSGNRTSQTGRRLAPVEDSVPAATALAA